MNIIDTHSHIYHPDFDGDITEVINRAKQAGLSKILLPNINVDSIDRVNSMAAEYKDYCLPMMGLHPTDVTPNWQSDLKRIKEEFAKHKYIAVGEIGIDLYWDKTFEKEQRQAFEEQLRWSIEYDLPVAIHSRDANKECVECVKNVGAESLRGVFHSFGGTLEELELILSLKNFYIGINGVVTYKNSGLADVLSHTDLSHIVVETDSPYLSPLPYRGKRNESSYVTKVITKLSEIYDLPEEEVADITTRNAIALFNL